MWVCPDSSGSFWVCPRPVSDGRGVWILLSLHQPVSDEGLWAEGADTHSDQGRGVYRGSRLLLSLQGQTGSQSGFSLHLSFSVAHLDDFTS